MKKKLLGILSVLVLAGSMAFAKKCCDQVECLDELEAHIMNIHMHRDGDDSTFRCDLCGEEGIELRLFGAHVRRHFGQELKRRS